MELRRWVGLLKLDIELRHLNSDGIHALNRIRHDNPPKHHAYHHQILNSIFYASMMIIYMSKPEHSFSLCFIID